MLRTSREIERATVTEDAELLAARLEVERLRGALRKMRRCFGPRDWHGEQTRVCEQADAALSAPPPDLTPLRDLVAATAGFAGTSADGTQGPIGRARDALLAAYPYLGDPECE
jgi:hypothetical protein